LSYTFQIYFDFSGYSDMAIGLALLFGITLPVNFESPYKADSIIEFWRRWHITLSAFLRDYLYVPLGGGRVGKLRRYLNLMITMLLGGLWHGAAWTFVAWGGLHGTYLLVNHAWRRRPGYSPAARRHTLSFQTGGIGVQEKSVKKKTPDLLSLLSKDKQPQSSAAVGRHAARLLTFVCVVVAWVLFRADRVETAAAMIRGMAGGYGVALPRAWGGTGGMGTLAGLPQLGWLAAALTIVWGFPNTQQIMADRWEPSARWAVIVAALAFLGIMGLTRASTFIYFNF